MATATSLLTTADITTGLLYDRVPEYFPFKHLDGENTGDSVYLNKDRYQLSYGMIASANIDSFTGIPIDSMWHLIEEFSEEETVYFGGMYYNYHKIRADAVDSGWITTDSTYYYDNTPQDTSLYELRRFFGMSSLKKYASGPMVTFYFDTNYMFTNIGFDTSSMEVDFDDGNGWHNISFNQTMAITYSVLDTMKHIRVRMQDTSGQWIYAKSLLYVYAVSQTTNHDFSIDPDGVIRIGETRIFDAGTPCCDIKEEFEDDKKDIERLRRLCEIRREVPLHLERNTVMKNGIEIFFWQNDTCGTPCHRKPLIIIEGFDPAEIYDYNLLFDDPQENVDEIGLMNQFYQMPQRLSEYINLEGYDLYFINFGYKNNTDSIQVNAEWLKLAINTINALKAQCGSVEKNVVVGASMGGLVGRWALAEMEAEGIDHETELFISFDSPLKGANVPIGLQALINDLRNTKIFGKPLGELNDGLEYGQRAMNYPAARQMLYYHRAPSGDIINTSASTLEQYHSSFQNNFDHLELSIPHLSIANGSLLNEDQGYPERDHILNNKLSIGVLTSLRDGFIQWAARGISGNSCLEYPPNNNVFQKIIEFEHATDILGGANIWLDVWAAPGKPNENQVYHKFMETHGILFPFVSYGYYNVDGLLPIDNAPGGTSRYESTEGSTNNLGFEETFYSFVPTPSALGIDVPTNLHTNLEDVNSVIETNNTVIREYRGAVMDNSDNPTGFTNQKHVSLDRNSAVWWRYHTESMGIDYEPVLTNLDQVFHFGAGSINAPDNLDPANLIPRKTDNYINNFVRVEPDAAIWIGTNNVIGYLPNNDAPLNEADSFEVFITDTYCDNTPIFVDIDSAAAMRLGSTVSNQSGIVYLQDNSRLNIYADGVLDMRSGSSMYIEDGTRLRLYPGADAYLDDSSRIIVEPGGELKIDSGASAYLDNSSFILIKEGGHLSIPGHAYVELNKRSQIILENGSELFIDSMGRTHLYSGSQIVSLPISTIRLTDSSKILLDGESSFQIDGNFFTEGDVEIEAPNGFLEFYAENNAIRSIGGNFRMNGGSSNNLLLLFHDFSYGLNVNAYNLQLYNGKVLIAAEQGFIWTNGGGPNGEYTMHNIHFLGQGNIAGGGTPYYHYGLDRALSLNKIKKLDVKDCKFENLTTGIAIQQSNNTDYKVENTRFTEVFTGIDATSTDHIQVNDCTFVNPQVEEQQATAGISLNSVDVLDLNKTSIHRFRCGIRNNHTISHSTINLKDCSEIVSCLIGIYGDSSFVHMNKSGLFYNGYGIAGYDIELDIASSGQGDDKNVYVLCQPNGIQSSAIVDDDTDTIDGPPVVSPPPAGPSELCGWYFSILNYNNTYSGNVSAQNNYWSPADLVYDGNYMIYHMDAGNAQYLLDKPQYTLTQEPSPGDCAAGTGGQEGIISDIEFTANSEIKVFPNPVQDRLRIESDRTLIMKVHDLSGKLMYTGTLNETQLIPTNGWEKGVYILDAGGHFFKVIKL